MKKQLIVIPLVLGLTFALGGCNNAKNDQLLNFIDAKMIDQNLAPSSEANLPNNYVSYNEYVFGPDEEYILLDDTNIELGVVVLRDSASGDVGYLDLNNGNNRFGSANASVRIISSRYLGYYVALNDDTNTYIADAFGNVFYDTNEYLNLTSVNEKTDLNGTLYVTLNYYNANSEYMAERYFYDNEGKIHQIVEEDLIGTNDGFAGLLNVDLDYLGIEGYNMVINSTNVIFITNDDGEFVNRIEIDVDADAGAFVNRKIVAQNINVLADDAVDYDFFDETDKTKYELITKTTDIITGEVEVVQIPYVIQGFEGLFNDKKGNPVYSLLSINEITPKKSIDTNSERNVLIDGNLNILQYLSEYNPLEFTKLDNDNYFNNGIIYDTKLKPVAYLGDVTYFSDCGVFLKENSSSFTFLDTNGNYLSNYIDGQIVGTVNSGYFMFTNNNQLFYGQINPENKAIEISQNPNYYDRAYTTISSVINNVVFLSYPSLENLDVDYVITSASGEFMHTNEFLVGPSMTGDSLECGLIYNTLHFSETLSSTDTIYHFVLNDQLTYTFK